MLIKRILLQSIENQLDGEPKIILLYGPRQAGKTTLIKEALEKRDAVVLLSGDDIRTQELFSIPNLDILRSNIGNTQLLVIDEAQRIPNIGLSLKLLYDAKPLSIIASGSSSMDLANKVSEPLTGRAVVYCLYPLSFLEVPIMLPDTSAVARLDEFLRFGMYPKVLTTLGEQEKQRYLNDLVNLYLYKDILTFENVNKPKKVIDLLTLLALQIGSEVSVLELSQKLGMSKLVVEKYLDILEKMFVIVNVRGFSRNLRNEITKMSKYYFVDLGLRNTLIQNFNPINLRTDVGGMFENFCIIERMKTRVNSDLHANYYFWRTYEQKEIDLVEERNGQLYTYEFKFSLKDSGSGIAVREFQNAYQGSTHMLVNPSNLEAFLRKE